ncbi:transmembrane protein, putative (macronuclear) [Tetrahymena thermophila SB210]|uniref:Transmembrane protein, putative n=1 Tax=Tetrahymena thermophila (strain SB210) TaxID=312017 RepID=W7X3G4_TETTS|nr:transmembrane protein, putative [Tetrahymena thermophila SB210]EWS72002.1 transmembrane protein, putative [Tetrahymena thermophila SB210]|eukprot:XP_012655458.1 transmembrane protein, putative [Tetrahymena thermophila SB210]
MMQIIYEVNLLVCTTIVSALPVYPLSFQKSGEVLSTLSLFIQGIISFQAEKVYLKNMRYKNESMDIVVSRQIGRKWGQCYLIVSIIYLLQLTLLYSFQALNMFSQIVFYFIDIIFKEKIQQEYNMPISALLISPLLFFIIIKRKKKSICNIKSKAFLLSSLSILIYIIYIMVIFFSHYEIDRLDSQLQYISILQIPNLLSSNNLAYVNQLYLHWILTFQNQRVAKQSKLSVKYSTLIIFIIYILVGNLGSYSIQNRQPLDQNNNNFIFDYFSDNALTVVVKIFMISHFFQNLSYKYLLLRESLLRLILISKQIQDSKQIKKRMKLIFNIIFPLFLTFINIEQSNLQYKFTVMTGSLAGFFIIYLIPYKLQFGKFKQTQRILFKNLSIQDSTPFSSIQEAQEEDSKLIESQSKLLPQLIQLKKLKKDFFKTSLKKANFFDKAILLFGFFISMYGILYFIYSVIN